MFVVPTNTSDRTILTALGGVDHTVRSVSGCLVLQRVAGFELDQGLVLSETLYGMLTFSCRLLLTELSLPLFVLDRDPVWKVTSSEGFLEVF